MNDKLIEPFSNQRCSVCNGFGTVTHNRITCHGCHGRGFIVIDNSTGFPVEDDRKIDRNSERENNPNEN